MRIARNCRIFLWGVLFAAALGAGTGFAAAQEEADAPLYNTQGADAPAPIFLDSPGGKGAGGGKAAVRPYDFSQGGAGKAVQGAGGGLAETQAKINADITAKTKALTSVLAKETVAKLKQAGDLTRKQMQLADAEIGRSTPSAKSSKKKKMVFDPNAQKKKGEERKNRIFNFR